MAGGGRGRCQGSGPCSSKAKAPSGLASLTRPPSRIRRKSSGRCAGPAAGPGRRPGRPRRGGCGQGLGEGGQPDGVVAVLVAVGLGWGNASPSCWWAVVMRSWSAWARRASTSNGPDPTGWVGGGPGRGHLLRTRPPAARTHQGGRGQPTGPNQEGAPTRRPGARRWVGCLPGLGRGQLLAACCLPVLAHESAPPRRHDGLTPGIRGCGQVGLTGIGGWAAGRLPADHVGCGNGGWPQPELPRQFWELAGGLEPPTCCLQDSSGSSTACWHVLSLQLTSGGSSSQCAPVGPSSPRWNDKQNDVVLRFQCLQPTSRPSRARIWADSPGSPP